MTDRHVVLYADLPDRIKGRGDADPECSSPGMCTRHPLGPAQPRAGSCVAAVEYGWLWFPCEIQRLAGDNLCWMHARKRDGTWLPGIKRHARERIEVSRRLPNSHERFFFVERFG